MRILITGGNGYVGRGLARSLFWRGHQVTVVDNLRSGALRFSADELRLFRFVLADIRDYSQLPEVIAQARPEVIVHLAAIHYIPLCEAEPEDAVRTNTLGTMNLLRACPPSIRFVFASTAAVYAPEDRLHDENTSAIGPSDVYGLTKLQAEAYVRHYASRLSLDARIVRLFNVVGPGETNPHVLPAILAQAKRGTQKLRLGNCSTRRDYVDVHDVADGFAAVALHRGQGPGVDTINLGTGQSYTVTELVDKLSPIAGIPFQIEVDQARLRPVDRPFASASIAKIGKHYGWAPRYRIEDTLRDLWQDPDISEEVLARC